MKHLYAFVFVFVLLCSVSAQATEIKEVTSPGGIRAWLVEDHKLPLIAMQFAFRGGVEQDPVAKQGLANLTMNLLSEGAGPYDAAAFQQQLADHSVALNFNASRDSLQGSVKALSAEKTTAFDLLHLALTQPHFETSAIERTRAQQLTGLRMQLGNPEWQGRYVLFQTIFGPHPYGERRLGSTQTLASLTKADIKSFATNHLAQNNLVIAVAGDISPRELGPLLDHIFGDLPKQAKLVTMNDFVWPRTTAIILSPREGTQTEVLFAMPGPKRNDKDWYATEIANYILGGGGFSSRLMQEVRDKKGLTYGISTGLSPMEYGGLIMGEAATDNAKTGQAWDITLDTMKHFYDDGVSEKEVDGAKDYLTGALPLAMTSTDKIAGILVDMQLDHLGRDYLDRRNDLLRQVSVDDVNQAVRRWFNPDGLTMSLVGKPEGITPTQTQDLTRN
jgi:zinc protease